VWKKVLNFVIAFALLASVVFAGIQFFRAYSLEKRNADLSESVARYRSDLELARKANDRYADAFREAKDTNTELGECLSEHVSTISQLREQIQAIRTVFDRMQSVIESMEDCSDIDISDYDYTDSGSDT
jgi:hypothetical protein